MNCQELTELLHAYLDRELDLVRSLEAEQHLKDCPACSRRYEEQQALRKAMAGGSLYFEAPRELRQHVRRAVRQASGAGETRRRGRWDLSMFWVRVLAPVAVAAVVLLLAVPLLTRPSAESRVAQEVVTAHVRSLMASHLTDVVSTDQHTVKPWFNGKVTFSPPVTDLAAQGYPIVGGRLDVLDEQPVAAVVYQRRRHYINLFIRPCASSVSSVEKTLAQRGYNLVHWTQGGMEYWAVSDLNAGELHEFTAAIRRAQP